MRALRRNNPKMPRRTVSPFAGTHLVAFATLAS
jgi:hypothetical protein